MEAPNSAQKSVTNKSADGKVDSTITISKPTAEAALKDNAAVKLVVPKDIAATDNSETAPKFKIDIPDGIKGLKVAIPVTNANTGTVAVRVNADGTEDVIPISRVNSDGSVEIILDGDITVKIINNSKTFTDVPSSHWAANYINFVASHEIFNGMGDGTFAPDDNMTRYMFAQVMFNMELDAVGGSSVSFTDIPSDHWARKAVAWASAKGIINGYSSTEFGGDDNITREQIATMLYRLSGSPEVTDAAAAGFPDAADISEYASTAMNWAVAAGLMNGMDDGRLAPQENATRAQVATMIQRYIDKVIFG
jgi:hypothetical protein